MDESTQKNKSVLDRLISLALVLFTSLLFLPVGIAYVKTLPFQVLINSKQQGREVVNEENISQLSQESVIKEIVEAEVEEYSQDTIELLNLLVAVLAAIPVFSGIVLWSLREAIKKRFTSEIHDEVSKTKNQALSDAEEKIKNSFHERFENEFKEKYSNQFGLLIEWSLFLIEEEIFPIVSMNYRKIFRKAFFEGFPSLSKLKSISSQDREKLEKFTYLLKKLTDRSLLAEQLTPSTYFIGGDVHFLLGNPEQAIKLYENALKCNKIDQSKEEVGETKRIIKHQSNSWILLQKGNAHFSLEDYQSAIDAYHKALDAYAQEVSDDWDQPKKEWIHYNLGMALHRQFHYEEAIEQFNLAHKLDPDDYKFLYWKGNAYAGQEEYQKAIESYQQALESLRTSRSRKNDKIAEGWILHSLADAYRKIGEHCHCSHHKCKCHGEKEELRCYKTAVDYYDKALEKNQNFEIYQKRAKTHRQIGLYHEKFDGESRKKLCQESYSQSCQDFKNALKNLKNNQQSELKYTPNLLANRAFVVQKLLNYSGSFTPDKSEDFNGDQSGEFLIAINQCDQQYQEIEGHLQKSDADYVKLAVCYFDMARCYALQEKIEDAKKYLQLAKDIYPKSHSVTSDFESEIDRWAKSDSDFVAIVAPNSSKPDRPKQCPLPTHLLDHQEPHYSRMTSSNPIVCIRTFIRWM